MMSVCSWLLTHEGNTACLDTGGPMVGGSLRLFRDCLQ